MASDKVTGKGVRAALEQMEAAKNGAKRTDQYTVKEAVPVFKEVTDNEYRKIVDQRRESFVVGKNKLGYDDSGREIWQDKEARSELARQDAELRKQRDAAKKAREAKGAAAGSKRKADGEGAQATVKIEPGTVKAEPMQVDSSAGAAPAVKEEPKDAPTKKIKIKGASFVNPFVKKPASDPVALRDWLKTENGAGAEVKAEPESQASQGPVAEVAAGRAQPKLADDGALWFYLTDAFEDDRASPPKIYLFGKVLVGHQYQSCCLVVESIERAFHLLLNMADPDPDDEAAAKEAALQAEVELHQLCPGLRKLRTKLKWRNYAFEKSLPTGAGYLPFLKVVYDPSGPAPKNGLSGTTFTNVFGAHQSLMEHLLLTRRIMGPSWLRLQPGSFQNSAIKISSCEVELRITPSAITAPKNEEQRRKLNEMGCPTSSPPLRLMTLNMQTVQKTAQHGHEPVTVACTMHPNFSADASESEQHLKLGMSSWRAVRRYDTRPLPVLPQHQVDAFPTEHSLFEALLQKIQDFDPDVIACHDAYGFDLEVLASRMSALNLNFWQKLGRLRRSKERIPRLEGRQGAGFWLGTNITVGRLVCDLSLQAKDLLPKLTSYDLPTLGQRQVGVDCLKEFEPEALPAFFDSGAALNDLAEHTWNNAVCIARLVHSLQILPLSKQLTNLAGNMWNASLQNKRAERNEMLLCHEFHNAKFLVPDKESSFTKKRRAAGEDTVAGGMDDPHGGDAGAPAAGPRRQKAAYTGGLVLEPKVGLYDEYVMLLDFNSLYPSIIQEHNICFTTVERPDENEVVKCPTEAELLALTKLPDGTVDDGILPQVLRRLVLGRQQVKTAMKSEKNPKTLQTLEIRQKALKLTANSMYGCLGFQNSRFYAKPLAALITAKGREALQTTINVVTQELTLEVVYGDTDSVFVNTKTTDYNEAMQVAQQIKRSVNKRYKKLEIEIDGVFGRLLLLKKKKYAGLKVVDQVKGVYEREYKGLDIVRRDWCGLAKGMGEAILDQILTCNEGKEEAVNWVHDFLTKHGKEMDEGKIAVEGYVITKGLTKAPQDYPDAKNQAHVQVALRLQERGKAVRSGQEIEYVICEATSADGPKESFAARARHLSELQLDPNLKIDVAWYKAHQVHPLVSRLLGPVEGTDAARIAECIGLDGAKFMQQAAAGGKEYDISTDYAAAAAADVEALMDRSKRFKGFSSMLTGLTCKACAKEVSWKQMLSPEVGDATGLDALFRCGSCGGELKPAQAQNVLKMQIRSLLKNHSEGWVQCTEEVSLAKTRRQHTGRNLTSERRVLQELEFLEHLTEGATKGYIGSDDRGCRAAATNMRKSMQWLLDIDGYNWVDCGKIFSGLCPV